MLRFAPKSPPWFRHKINGFGNNYRSTINDELLPFARTFYISFPKITLRMHLQLSLPRRAVYNSYRYQ